MLRRVLSIMTLLALGIIFAAAPGALAADREFAPVQNGFVPQGELVPEYAPGRVIVKLTPAAARIALQAGAMAAIAAIWSTRDGV